MSQILTSILLIIVSTHITMAQQIIRGPYLTCATSSGITIQWRTDIPCNSRVEYGPAAGVIAGGQVDMLPVTDHIITLSGLNPGTCYHYLIATSGQILNNSPALKFCTLPSASAGYQQAVRLMAVGDAGKGSSGQSAMKHAVWQHLQGKHLDGLIWLGDNAYEEGTDGQYQQNFFDYYQQPLLERFVNWPVTGNHEYANDYNLRISKSIDYYSIFQFPEQGESGGLASNRASYYAVDIGNVHLIVLDSYGLEDSMGLWWGLSDTLFSRQFRWLRQDLQANKLPWTLVAFHHPPYCMGSHNSDSESELALLRQRLNPVFESFNVDLVLNGHCHTYQRSQFLRGHTGNEASFDTLTHRIQPGGGQFHFAGSNDCPYVKGSIPALGRDSGTIYLVSGAGSDYPGSVQASWPHAAMFYGNALDNGSLLVTIEGNKLTGEWVCTDTSQPVKDRFTVYKSVNRHQVIFAFPGQSVQLKASWNEPGDYVWTGGDTNRTMQIIANPPQTIIVNNQNHCLSDTFDIQIAAPVNLESKSLQTLELSPNPARDILTLSHLPNGEVWIQCTDNQGRLVLSQSFQNQDTVPLDIQALPPGIYTLMAFQNRRPFAIGRFMHLY